jgi:nucleoid DNA-binding protein
MNKGEFVRFLATRNECSIVDAEKALNLVTSGIIDAMREKMPVHLVNFGSFYTQHREERIGRNPKTGVKMHIPAYYQVMFKTGKGMRDAANGDAVEE